MSAAEIAGGVVSEPPQRSIIARPITGGAVHTIIGPESAQRGPWSFITGTPHPTEDMVGPPATYLAIAAWAAGTVNTRHVVRRIVLHGTPGAILVQAIEAALQHDPLALSFRSGGVLLGEQLMVT